MGDDGADAYVHERIDEPLRPGKVHYAVVGGAGAELPASSFGYSFHKHALIRADQLDATISQPANSYAQYAVFYSRQALEGKTYSASQTTDHNSTIVSLQGNLEDALPAPVVDKTNVNDPNLWGNSKSGY